MGCAASVESSQISNNQFQQDGAAASPRTRPSLGVKDEAGATKPAIAEPPGRERASAAADDCTSATFVAVDATSRAQEAPPLVRPSSSGGAGAEHMASKHQARAYSSKLLDAHLELFREAGGRLEGGALPPVGPDDALVVIDMQNDFVPTEDAPEGGRFAVAEGASASEYVVRLIELFAAKGARVIASKDYHPDGHCSFMERNGPFPAHCVQGSPGSQFFPPVGAALKKALDEGKDVHIVHKGFHEDIDSFGAFPYPRVGLDEARLSCKDISCCPLWTGGYELKCSNQKADINAPPDILSILEERRVNMQAVMDRGCKEGSSKQRRMFVVGLALDFCVLDTINNAISAGYSNVFCVAEATRAAHIPGVGKFGGFLTDPAHIVKCFEKVKFIQASSLGVSR